MATRQTRKSSPKKQPAAVETSESIAEQTRRFLESGNKIEVVDSHLSKQPPLSANEQRNPREG